MEFTDNFETDVWVKADPKTCKGFVPYTIVRPQMLAPGKFQYAIKEIKDSDEDVKFEMASLDGGKGKRDPLANIRNCDMVIKDGVITAVNVEGDCVVRKQ